MEAIVSIIIPHFNRSVLLKKAIDSVIAQTYKAWEIIIVDDGSAVTELTNIKEFGNDINIKVLERDNAIKGPSSCRNLGVQLSKGKYLIFLDSDDLLAPFCLQQRMSIIENNHLQLAIFKMEEFITTPGDKGTIYNKAIAEVDWAGSFIRNENPWNVTCPIWQKDFFETIGGFDEELLFMEDPELHLRAVSSLNAQIKTCYDKPADCYYRINNLDDTKLNFWYNSIFYRLSFYKKIIVKKNLQTIVAQNTHNLKLGIYNLAKNFLYSRKNQFPQLYENLISMMHESKLFSWLEIVRLAFLMNLGNTQFLSLKKLKLRGICYKLLPGK